MSDSSLNLPAAEYLRMSTEHQQYSLDNQHAAITAYAENRHFSVVKTYTDGAKSGVVLKRREGLRQLLQDVMRGHTDYRAILVYDVSRWGRFQVCNICHLPITHRRDSCIQIQSSRRVHLKCHQREAMAKERARLKT
jgi:DNA invertase Pin-like site-specific DNA recombinase